jgi:cytochrome c oxidase subunit 4
MSEHAAAHHDDHDVAHDPEERAAHRRSYRFIFVWLTVLTVLEVGVTYLSLPKSVMMTLLIGLACTKAALVGLFFMHLKYEKKSLLWLAAIPFPLAGLYAALLMLDAHGLLRVITLPWK